MMSAEHDLAAREPVWSALSELYLDNGQYRSSVRAAARDLAASPYALDELREILMHEVHPVLVRNLCVSAGVWDRFDQTWLSDRILRGQRRAPWLRPRAFYGLVYARLLWRLLEPRIRRCREAGPDAVSSCYLPRTAR